MAPPDQAERDLIRRELGINLVVEAAAGTGKTTSLAGRMVALLESGACRTENLAAVTFTRKAAAELRARFQGLLETATAQPLPEQNRNRLRQALERLDLCFIGTIHSFCARLVRERPVEAGVDPTFVELEEEADRQLRLEAWDLFATRLYQGGRGRLLPQLSRLGLTLGELRDGFVRFADYPDIEEWPVPADSGPPDLKPARQEILEYLEHMRRVAPDLPEDPGGRTLFGEYRLLPAMRSHLDFDDPADLVQVLERFQGDPPPVSRELVRGGYFKVAEAERERWRRVAATARAALDAFRVYRYRTVREALQRAQESYDQLRRERRVLSFQDLLLKAAALLREHPAVRASLGRRFTHVLVDEFQDTDPIQAEVMLLLTSTNVQETSWRRCVPRPGSLFVVGDPKQSIYRFRRADIVTYRTVKDIIRQSGGRLLTLRANFRTVAPVREWVNTAFQRIFPAQESDQSPAWVALEPGRDDPGHAAAVLHGLRALVLPPDACKNNEQAVRFESERIARFIHQALVRGLTISRTPQELREGKMPRVTPGDFLIIARNRAHLGIYAERLAERGIPNRVTGGSVLNDVLELKLLLRCLEAAIQPDDPLATVAVLRSELFGLSDRSLYSFKKAGGAFSFTRDLPAGLAEEDRSAFADAFTRLRAYAHWMRSLPPIAAIERIVGDLGLLPLAASRPGGDVPAGSLAKAIEVLRCARDQAWSVSQLVAHLGRLESGEESHDGITALSGEAPAVRVLNLHKAKGLEAPVVFLADPTGGRDHPVEAYLDRSAERTRGYQAILGPKQGHHRSLLAVPERWEELRAREKAFLEAEEIRLRYVAATRAGSMLVITLRPKHGKDNPWNAFAADLREVQKLEDWPADPVAPSPAGEALNRDEVMAAMAEIGARRDEVRQKTHAVSAAKEYALSGAEGTVPRQEEAPAPVEQPLDGEHGLEWGSVIHSLLEHALLRDKADLEPLAVFLLEEYGIDERRAAQAMAQVRAILRSELWQRARQAKRRLAEVPFHTLLPAAESRSGLPTVLRGVIDLAFEEPDGWVIVDYKTDQPGRAGVEALVERYSPQVQLYRTAWERSTGARVKEIGLFFTGVNRYWRLSSGRGY